VSRGRLEAFSDGVFAIAITLLVLTIAQPTNYRHLGEQLASRWPSFAAYVVSFAVIGIMWLNHHSIFGHFARIDRGLVFLNLLLLMTVVFIPYPTAIFGEALKRGQGEDVAAIVYSFAMWANAVSWAAFWLYASGKRRLLDDTFPESQRSTATMLFTVPGVVLYTIAIVIAFVNAYACLAFHGLLALYYALDPLSRWAVGRAAAERDTVLKR
jgi:uncharacterized membrane protein